MAEAADRTIEWLTRESMGDATLLRLIGAREQVIKEGIMFIHGGGSIPEPLRSELSGIGQLITERKTKLHELQDRAEGDELLFHLLIQEDDLREAVEVNPNDPVQWEKWEAAKAAITEYQSGETPPFTE